MEFILFLLCSFIIVSVMYMLTEMEFTNPLIAITFCVLFAILIINRDWYNQNTDDPYYKIVVKSITNDINYLQFKNESCVGHSGWFSDSCTTKKSYIVHTNEINEFLSKRKNEQ